LATNALKLSHVDAFYGDSHVLGDVSFELGEARMLGLLGRNGAGKSTSRMNATWDFAAAAGGEVIVRRDGDPQVSGNDRRTEFALVPQGRRIFKSLTVQEPYGCGSKPEPRQQTCAVTTIYRVQHASAPERAPQSRLQHTCRRRATDARHRPCAHGQPACSNVDG
jgi:ABC-type branched-subunit amino acid transport system ATPase component